MEETEVREIYLSAGALRRIARLHARVEGARATYQVVLQSLDTAQAALQEALNVACEDQGMRTPTEQTPIDIDWTTGRIWLREEVNNGRVHQNV